MNISCFGNIKPISESFVLRKNHKPNLRQIQKLGQIRSYFITNVYQYEKLKKAKMCMYPLIGHGHDFGQSLCFRFYHLQC